MLRTENIIGKRIEHTEFNAKRTINTTIQSEIAKRLPNGRTYVTLRIVIIFPIVVCFPIIS